MTRLLSLVLLVACACAVEAHAQSGPLAAGTVTVDEPSVTCPGTTKKRVEKLRYMHRNPVKRGLVESPEQWRWSSYRFYFLEEAGPVRVNEGRAEISFRNRVA